MLSYEAKKFVAMCNITKMLKIAKAIRLQGGMLNQSEWEWNFKDGSDHRDPENIPFVVPKADMWVWYQSPLYLDALNTLLEVGAIEKHPQYDRYRINASYERPDIYEWDEVKDYIKQRKDI